ncbi:hypothetical protein C1646_694883 [Rhizophagus diaphanus]|nr:hypothetical protein C1646_694883 [Rhizophagus diaphanus] [Rhizophagus sp. MUCL 43196]
MSKEKVNRDLPSPSEIVIEKYGRSREDNSSDTSSVRGRGRLKALTKKVIAANRLLSAEQIHLAGQDPGIDPKYVDYDIHTNCKIFCADFSEKDATIVKNLTNESLEEFLQKERPPESRVRWINIDGISWDVIKILSIHYDLHPLAIEDSLQGDQRTKLDQYQNHLYVSLLLHTLVESTDKNDGERNSERISERNAERNCEINDESDEKTRTRYRKDLLTMNHREDSIYLETHKLLRKQKLHVTVEQVSIFLLENHILITIFKCSGSSVYKPILARINQSRTLLRTAQEASLLMEAVIDGIVDLAIPIKDSYRHQIAELEGKLLIRPKMDYTRELHIISGELTILKRTLGPVQGLVTLLREHSDEKNLISHLARTYFMDVSDHIIEIVDDLDTMTKITENLVNMIFNLIAYETNENMRTIAIFSIVFLPMTFIAGCK